MAGREWRPGEKGQTDRMLAQMLEDGIEGQRSITEYEGSDGDWRQFVANKNWDVDDYQKIGFNDGYLSAILHIIEETKAMVSPGLIDRANLYIYER